MSDNDLAALIILMFIILGLAFIAFAGGNHD